MTTELTSSLQLEKRFGHSLARYTTEVANALRVPFVCRVPKIRPHRQQSNSNFLWVVDWPMFSGLKKKWCEPTILYLHEADTAHEDQGDLAGYVLLLMTLCSNGYLGGERVSGSTKRIKNGCFTALDFSKKMRQSNLVFLLGYGLWFSSTWWIDLVLDRLSCC